MMGHLKLVEDEPLERMSRAELMDLTNEIVKSKQIFEHFRRKWGAKLEKDELKSAIDYARAKVVETVFVSWEKLDKIEFLKSKKRSKKQIDKISSKLTSVITTKEHLTRYLYLSIKHQIFAEVSLKYDQIHIPTNQKTKLRKAKKLGLKSADPAKNPDFDSNVFFSYNEDSSDDSPFDPSISARGLDDEIIEKDEATRRIFELSAAQKGPRGLVIERAQGYSYDEFKENNDIEVKRIRVYISDLKKAVGL